MPDIIQFKNGNQIKNLYDASGHKLGTEYFTQLTNISPLTDGQIVNQNYISGAVDQSGTVYIGNIEYNTLHGNASQTTLSRIYNDEGYVENPANPQYYYFRHDHLGDNREVWLANTNTTVQRTQYYPSGLPWAYQIDDNPGLQHRKYNGKEFVEMHGYDTYDIEWRQYYPAIMRFQTPDPQIEDAYNLSPYTMCSDNMVNKIDPDGRFDWAVFGKVMLQGAKVEGAEELAGAGPEDPVADLVAAGTFLVYTGIAIHHAIQATSQTTSNSSYNQSTNTNSITNNNQSKSNVKTGNSQTTAAAPAPKNPKKEAREDAKQKRKEQDGSEKKAKDNGKKLEKAKGKDARRQAHDMKEKGSRPNRTDQQLNEDYNPDNYNDTWERTNRGKK